MNYTAEIIASLATAAAYCALFMGVELWSRRGSPDVELTRKEQIPMRPDLLDIFEMDELKKYFTGEELGGHRADQGERA